MHERENSPTDLAYHNMTFQVVYKTLT
jgi:hypothetical protein